MGISYRTVTVLEQDTTDGDWPVVSGKGRHKDNLVYFSLDAKFLREPVFVGASISVTDDEVSGIAPNFF